MPSDSCVLISLSTALDSEQSSLLARLSTRLNVSTESETRMLIFLSWSWFLLRPDPKLNFRFWFNFLFDGCFSKDSFIVFIVSFRIYSSG